MACALISAQKMEYSPVLIFLNFGAANAVLIRAVSLVGIGIELAFGDQLRQWLRHSTKNRRAAAAILLQSSTAVALLRADVVADRSIGVASGFAIIPGADLGSATVVLILTSRIAVLTPVLLLC